jgi:hypothetical protein
MVRQKRNAQKLTTANREAKTWDGFDVSEGGELEETLPDPEEQDEVDDGDDHVCPLFRLAT